MMNGTAKDPTLLLRLKGYVCMRNMSVVPTSGSDYFILLWLQPRNVSLERMGNVGPYIRYVSLEVTPLSQFNFFLIIMFLL